MYVPILAHRLLSALDEDAKPCDDFYQFACGNWMHQHIPDITKLQISQFTQTRKMICKDIQGKQQQQQNFLTLLSHRPLCGQATSVPDTDTQVTWQDTQALTSKVRPEFLRWIFSSSSTLFVITLSNVGACLNALIRPNHLMCTSRWRGEPLFGHSGCRPATYCVVWQWRATACPATDVSGTREISLRLRW